jgi:hypothetical protein
MLQTIFLMIFGIIIIYLKLKYPKKKKVNILKKSKKLTELEIMNEEKKIKETKIRNGFKETMKKSKKK